MATTTVGIAGLDDLAKLINLVSPENFAKAQAAGMRYAARSITTVVAKGIAESYGITSARVRKDIRKPYVAPNGSYITIAFNKRKPTLSQFAVKPGDRQPQPGSRSPQPGRGRGRGWGQPKPARQPLTALQLRTSGRQAIPGAFQAVGKKGNLVVLRRMRSGKLRGVYGPAIGEIFLGQSRVSAELQARVRERVATQYRVGFARALRGGQRGYGLGEWSALLAE